MRNHYSRLISILSLFFLLMACTAPQPPTQLDFNSHWSVLRGNWQAEGLKNFPDATRLELKDMVATLACDTKTCYRYNVVGNLVLENKTVTISGTGVLTGNYIYSRTSPISPTRFTIDFMLEGRRWLLTGKLPNNNIDAKLYEARLYQWADSSKQYTFKLKPQTSP